MISKKMAHAGLVSETDFVAAQAIRAARPTGDGSTRTYLLAGLLRCVLGDAHGMVPGKSVAVIACFHGMEGGLR